MYDVTTADVDVNYSKEQGVSKVGMSTVMQRKSACTFIRSFELVEGVEDDLRNGSHDKVQCQQV